jgi:hypothetical protein
VAERRDGNDPGQRIEQRCFFRQCDPAQD